MSAKTSKSPKSTKSDAAVPAVAVALRGRPKGSVNKPKPIVAGSSGYRVNVAALAKAFKSAVSGPVSVQTVTESVTDGRVLTLDNGEQIKADGLVLLPSLEAAVKAAISQL